ncbi:ATP-binding cassette domain-containing protein [Sphingobacterium faecium]|uniref:ATP-binding cassette domain-containing protein n=1 Tax=Sphingobacterium faecium TaxID=34087 RepID=UPI0021B5B869|nr:ATP-binding cassette domain-containing protein [Sphingobacterium faecium]UXD71360.1 ATP-binding cassette domain-containing protein [Sphingobacterium faecium]
MPLDRSLYLDSLSYSRGGRMILSGLFLELEPSTIVGLLGRNGTGKSTLMNCIFGNCKPDFAYMKCDGQIFNQGYKTKKITYLTQYSFIPKRLTLLRAIQYFDLEDSPIMDIDIVKERLLSKIGDLSTGLVRLFECLLVLYSKANYCLLDEPFSGLSPLYIDMIKQHILAVKSLKGILISDHYYTHVMDVSDRLLLLTGASLKSVQKIEDLVLHQYLK